MTQSLVSQIKHRGRLLPHLTLTPEELAQRKAERQARFQRCKAIFDKVAPQLRENHYDWYMAIEPHSGDYFIDADKDMARQKARQKYPELITCMFCLNETGACGRI